MPTQTHPTSRVAGDIFDIAIAKIGVIAASRFMFVGNPALDGSSPIEALRAGRHDAVSRVILDLLQGTS